MEGEREGREREERKLRGIVDQGLGEATCWVAKLSLWKWQGMKQWCEVEGVGEEAERGGEGARREPFQGLHQP